MPTIIHALLVLCPVALASAGVVAGAGDVGLALARADGRLLPLATVSGDRWSPLAAAGAAGGWSLWLFDDAALLASPFAARAARPVTAAAADAGCLALSGLEAGLQPGHGAVPAARQPASRGAPAFIGLALSGTDLRPDLPVAVAPDSALGKELEGRAAAAFHRAEDETLTLEAEELPAGFPRFATRRARPITWTVMARQGFARAASKSYFLEGRKDYEGFRGRTDIGQIRTTGHVFVRLDGERATIDAEVDLSDVDGHQSILRTPLAIVAWPGRSAWLFAARGPGGSHIEIVELTAGTSRPRTVWQGSDGCEQGVR